MLVERWRFSQRSHVVLAGPDGTPYKLSWADLLNHPQLLSCFAFEHALQIIDPPTGNFPSLQQIANLIQSEVGKHWIKHWVEFSPVLHPQLIGFELRFVLNIESLKKVLVLLGSANTNDNGKGFGVIEAIGDDVGVVVTHPLGIDTSI